MFEFCITLNDEEGVMCDLKTISLPRRHNIVGFGKGPRTQTAELNSSNQTGEVNFRQTCV